MKLILFASQDHPRALQLREDSVHDLLNPSVIHEGTENTALMFELKLIFLLGLASEYVACLGIFRRQLF
jgi:hypothetical protein